MNWTDVAGVGLLAVGGFLAGGTYTAWRTSRTFAAVLAAAALIAVVAGVLWLL